LFRLDPLPLLLAGRDGPHLRLLGVRPALRAHARGEPGAPAPACRRPAPRHRQRERRARLVRASASLGTGGCLRRLAGYRLLLLSRDRGVHLLPVLSEWTTCPDSSP